jgi:hypothetical protein
MAETDLAAPPGQQQNTMPPTRGLGDSSNPIFRPSDKRPDEPTAPPGKRNMVDDMRRALQKELDEKKRLEEERRRQGEDPSEEPSEDDPRYRNEGDQPDPNGDAADEDDWDEDEGEIDPNAPADPNHPVDPNHPADPNHPVDPNHPADPNHP